MIAILGSRSRIATEFSALCGETTCGLMLDPAVCRSTDRLLICTGFLAGKSLSEINSADEETTWRVNYSAVAKYVDGFLAEHEAGRVVVIGSDSGFAGSYDTSYAGAKAALHLYVETRQLRPRQQLVAIAPSIIADAGMTIRRHDLATLKRRESEHPKKRLCTSREVASLAAWLLGPDGEYVSSTVVRMNGGARK